MTSPALLTVNGLCVDYELASGTVRAVRDVSFTLAQGGRIGIVGESGSGKTTLALALLGMLRQPGRVVAGRAELDGRDLTGLSPAEHASLRLSKIAYVPQGAMNSLNPVQTVRRSIADGLADHEGTPTGRALDARIAGLLEQVGLNATVAQRYPHELSGGMKQRVCIAIAISLSPRLILADEPTSALDVVTQRQVMETLRQVQSRIGSGLVLIGHDMGLMAQCVDHLLVMKDGHVVEAGSTRDVLRTPAQPYTRELIASVPMFGELRTREVPVAASAVAAQPIITLEGAGRHYAARGPGRETAVALHPLDLCIDSRPRILSIVGQSGSGKTTLGNMMLGFTEPTEGKVLYQGQAVAKLRGEALRSFRREVQAVFQDPYSAFNPFYRVDRALSSPLFKLGLVRDHDEARTRMEKACTQVGLDPALVLGRFAHQLSGGQRQRLMVARALMLQPRVLIADEPVSMVDASLRLSILDALKELRDVFGISIVYITHDLATAYEVSDYVIVLNKGRVVEAGTPEIVIKLPAHAYTRELVASIPWPDPDRSWGAPNGMNAAETMAHTSDDVRTIVRDTISGFQLST